MHSNAAAATAAETPPPVFLEQHLELARSRAAVLNLAIEGHGQRALGDYVAGLRPGAAPRADAREDFLAVVSGYTRELLGAGAARRVCRQLEHSPCALTANHHGVDFFAQSVQGTLLFSLADTTGAAPAAVPVFACGLVPLDNLTYPMGMLFYEPGARGPDSLPLRLPVFSNKVRRSLVSAAPAMTEEMIQRACGRIKKLICDEVITAAAGDAALDLLQSDYAAPQVLDLPDYSSQAVVLNRRIWRRLHNHAPETPELVYLELERISTELLVRDLANAGSLVSRVLFDRGILQATVRHLDGARACWDQGALARRLGEGHGGAGAGTMFFWGINARRRRVPLYLDDSGCLRGIDDQSLPFSIPFEPQALIEGLHSRRLAPALFTTFMALSFDRGIRCFGGYYQAEYLPAMQAGLVRALERCQESRDLADRVRTVDTGGYLGGMQAVMQRVNGQGLMPAGVLEMLAAGGLEAGHRRRVGAMSVRDAHLVSLMETLDDLGLARELPPSWRQQLMQATDAGLSRRVVVL